MLLKRLQLNLCHYSCSLDFMLSSEPSSLHFCHTPYCSRKEEEWMIKRTWNSLSPLGHLHIISFDVLLLSVGGISFIPHFLGNSRKPSIPPRYQDAPGFQFLVLSSSSILLGILLDTSLSTSYPTLPHTQSYTASRLQCRPPWKRGGEESKV